MNLNNKARLSNQMADDIVEAIYGSATIGLNRTELELDYPSFAKINGTIDLRRVADLLINDGWAKNEAIETGGVAA